MKTFKIINLVFLVSLFALGVVGIVKAVTDVSLGEAENYAVLAGSAITNTGATTINGDAGSSPIPTETGFGPGANSITFTSGVNHDSPDPNDATTQLAQTNLTTAYNDAAGQTSSGDLTGQDLGGLTLVAGTYTFSSSAQLTGNLTLNGQGDPNAVFIFQIGSTLTTASGSSITLVNGAQSCHVFWQVGSSATLGTTTSFVGNIMALTSITLNTGATVDGRVLARNGAVTLDTNTITLTECGAVPLINVAKTANPVALSSGSGTVIYDYIATNLGAIAMSDITISDNKCTPVNFVSGDTNSDQNLDTDEAWNYSCTAALSATTTNTVTVTGVASGLIARATADTTVIVSSTTADESTTKSNTVIVAASPVITTSIPQLPNTGIAPAPYNIFWVVMNWLLVLRF